jgi:hypothetical protein
MTKLFISTLIIFALTSCSGTIKKGNIDTSKIISPSDNAVKKIKQLDSIYQSALHVDTSLAVFKTDADQQKMFDAYSTFLQDFGKFLKQNNFTWGQETKCWNRLYFDKDGSVDYYIYNFKSQIEKAKEEQFKLLFAEYIMTHKINITADKKFAQCSPVRFLDN